MKKRALSLLMAWILSVSLLLPVTAATATKLIPTNIPTSFPTVKMDPSFTLVNFWSSTGSQNAAVDNLVNWFNATTGKAKKIYVKNVYQGAYTDIATKVQATVSARDLKDLPDIAQLAPQGVFALKESPYILYVDDMIKADKSFTYLDKMNKNLLYACSYKGRIMGLPFSNVAIVLHYNAAAYRAVGLDPANPPKTMADYAEVCKKLVIKNDKGKVTRYGAAYKLDGTNIATWITRQKGGKGTAFQFDKEDGHLGAPTKYLCAEDGTLKALLTEWKKVVDTGTVDITNSNATNFAMGLSANVFGNMGNYVTIEAYFKGVRDKTKVFEHKVARLPSVNADDGTSSHIGGAAIYMFDKGDTKKKAAAWEFVKFLCSVDVSAYWSFQSCSYAINMDALNTKYVQDAFNKDPNQRGFYTVLSDSATNPKAGAPMIPNSQVYLNVTADQGYLYLKGKQTVDKTIENIAKKENAILKAWNDANS